MALLIRPIAQARRSRAVLGLALAALAGCVILDAWGGPAPAFSHRIHVVDEELDCVTCHQGAEDGDQPGMPGPAVCQLCHESLDEEKPPDQRVTTFFDQGGVYRAARLAALSDEVVFSHADHVQAGAACEDCHADVGSGDRVGPGVAVSMDDCSACHLALGQPDDCATCHASIREDVAPGTHGQHWDVLHGKVYRAGSEAVVDRCSLCHQESSCTSCHRDEMPSGHTNYWRRRGHGLTARMDRQGCFTCHQTDSCDRCHRESLPANHGGPWGSPQNSHCMSCHLTGPGEGCVTCHVAAPSHALAAPKPPDHSPGMNCLLCHGVTQPLPHVTKGDDCNFCHP